MWINVMMQMCSETIVYSMTQDFSNTTPSLPVGGFVKAAASIAAIALIPLIACGSLKTHVQAPACRTNSY